MEHLPANITNGEKPRYVLVLSLEIPEYKSLPDKLCKLQEFTDYAKL